jgi:hypothetical protein
MPIDERSEAPGGIADQPPASVSAAGAAGTPAPTGAPDATGHAAPGAVAAPSAAPAGAPVAGAAAADAIASGVPGPVTPPASEAGAGAADAAPSEAPSGITDLPVLEAKLTKRGFRRDDMFLHECPSCHEQAVFKYITVGKTGGRDIALCAACGVARSWRSGAGFQSREEDVGFDLRAFLR